MVAGVRRQRQELDALVERVADNWSLKRMAATDRNVLRLGAYELLHTDTPPRVAVNEAVELAKRFGSAQSSQFVNGILDKVMRDKEGREERGERRGGGCRVRQSCAVLNTGERAEMRKVTLVWLDCVECSRIDVCRRFALPTKRNCPPAVRAEELCNGNCIILGRLGKPYGEITKIRAVGNMEKNLAKPEGPSLRITHIDGKKLADDQQIIVEDDFIERLGINRGEEY